MVLAQKGELLEVALGWCQLGGLVGPGPGIGTRMHLHRQARLDWTCLQPLEGAATQEAQTADPDESALYLEVQQTQRQLQQQWVQELKQLAQERRCSFTLGKIFAQCL